MTETEALRDAILAKGVLPGHVAIIMDGNGRWAKRRRLPRIMGHREGRKAVRRTVEAAADLGIKTLTLYTFSIENWARPAAEVKALMQFLEEVLRSEFLELEKNNIRLTCMGHLDRLPEGTRKILDETRERLSTNTGMTLNLALSYSGRAEIVDAARAFAERVARGEAKPEDLDEDGFGRILYRPEEPDIDLLIRTSGELRISNFCLWQLAYTEIHITQTYWPDFGPDDLYRAIADFQTRERRFGRVL